MCAGVARFCQGVFDKRAMEFVGFADAELFLGNDGNIQRRQDRLNFAQLTGIGAGDDQFSDLRASSAVRCAVTNS